MSTPTEWNWDDESVDMALASISRNMDEDAHVIANLANIADYFMVEVIDHLERIGEPDRASYIYDLHNKLRELFPLEPTQGEKS